MKSFTHLDIWPDHLENRYAKPVNNHKNDWKKYSYKRKIQENLLSAQYHICPYCEIELMRHDGHVGYHIEHIEPKSKKPSKTFDYKNLLLSCFTDKSELQKNNIDRTSLCCGHFKDDNFCENLFIDPSKTQCENFFQYEVDGEIAPLDSLTRDEKAKALYTINRLNLNSSRLTRERGELILHILEQTTVLLGKDVEMEKFINLELSIKEGKSNSFTTTRVFYLKDLQSAPKNSVI